MVLKLYKIELSKCFNSNYGNFIYFNGSIKFVDDYIQHDSYTFAFLSFRETGSKLNSVRILDV